MSYVLAIEPNQGQANVLRDVTADTLSKVVVVGSVQSAMAAMEHGIPSVILVNALMPPNEESDLIERLRGFPNDTAPEILITPDFSESERKDRVLPGTGRFGRRRVQQPRSAGSARLNFTEQLSTYLSFVQERHASAALTREPEPAPEPVSLALVPERELSGAERRASVRIESVEWARLRINGTPVKVVDLSATGAQILSPGILRLGDSVHVMLVRDADIVQCDAGIVWGAFDMFGPASTPLFRAGISFKDHDRLVIEQLCIDRHRTGPDGPFFQSKDY